MEFIHSRRVNGECHVHLQDGTQGLWQRTGDKRHSCASWGIIDMINHVLQAGRETVA